MVCFHDMRWQIDPSCYCFAVRKHGGNSENKGLVGVFVFKSFPNKPNVAAITLYRFIKLMLASWMQVTTHFTVAQRKTFTKVKSVKSWREAPQIAQLALFFLFCKLLCHYRLTFAARPGRFSLAVPAAFVSVFVLSQNEGVWPATADPNE